MNDDEIARTGTNHTLHRLRPRRPDHRLRNWLFGALVIALLAIMLAIGYDADSARLGYGNSPAPAWPVTPTALDRTWRTPVSPERRPTRIPRKPRPAATPRGGFTDTGRKP